MERGGRQLAAKRADRSRRRPLPADLDDQHRDRGGHGALAIGTGEGGDVRAPLGRAVIGGVITATLLTLLVIPTFYDILAGARDRVRRRGLTLGAELASPVRSLANVDIP